MSNTYDIAIVGAGMVGLTAAAALARLNLNIAVIDSREPQLNWDADSNDLRVSAMTLASEQILKNLQVWGAVEADRLSTFRDMYVWDEMSEGDITFCASSIGQRCLGHIIENRVIVRALYQYLQQQTNVTLLCPTQVVSLQQDQLSVSLETDTNTIIADLLVGADGGNSWVRQQVGIPVQERDYSQSAVVATVNVEIPHLHIARQRFLRTGPLAFLPLANDQLCSIVWSITPERAQELTTMEAHTFNSELEKAFDFKLGQVEVQSKRVSFPLRMRHAERYTDARVVLIGDSAHTIHPLAGQGANLGLLDAACLAESIEDALQRRIDFADPLVLSRYQRWRMAHNRDMSAAMTGFHRLFTSVNKPLQKLRGIGMNLTDDAAPFKDWLISRAMGLEGDLPKLAQSIT